VSASRLPPRGSNNGPSSNQRDWGSEAPVSSVVGNAMEPKGAVP
jgi:hypothetical protein